MFNVNRDLEVIRLTAEYGSEEIHNCMKENKKLKQENKKIRSASLKSISKLNEENKKITEENQGYVATIHEMEKENKGLQKELQDVRKLELAHMDTIKKLKSDAKDISRYWECIMDFCHNPDNPNKDYIVQWCELNEVSDVDKIELLNAFGFYEEE